MTTTGYDAALVLADIAREAMRAAHAGGFVAVDVLERGDTRKLAVTIASRQHPPYAKPCEAVGRPMGGQID